MTKAKTRLLSFLLILCFLFTACGEGGILLSLSDKPDYNNTVTVLDVGQAACSLIESEGQFALIDAGDAGGSTNIIAYLHSRGVEKIDLLVLSHFHYDHTSEALDIIRNFEIGTVVIPDLSEEMRPDSYFYQSLWEDAANGYYNLDTAAKDKTYIIGSGSVKILADTINTLTENDTSIALSYTNGDFVYVNTADMEAEAEAMLMDVIPTDVDLFSAGHHGSSTSNTYEFVEKLNPGTVFISCGAENDYGHPHSETIETFASLGVDYYITYEQGTMVYSITTGEIFTD
ncbi:MAG: MBL fold metallo-hydrolase [Oscillospiraceae bacterium]|nr:MBL fold metallo-hydrolase [Oscillospiraceae bacterium]